MNAEAKLEAAAGHDLPFFVAYPKKGGKVTGEDGDDEDRTVVVRYETCWYYENSSLFSSCHSVDVEGEFEIPEDVLIGIALGRDEDVETFLDLMLPNYRALEVAADLMNRCDLFDGGGWRGPLTVGETSIVAEDARLGGWQLAAITADAASRSVFRLRISFWTPHFDARTGESADGMSGDLLYLPMTITWDEYREAISSKEETLRFIRRVYQQFTAFKGSLSSGYTEETADTLREIDEADDEDPFMTGELVVDGDGRVHFGDAFDDDDERVSRGIH